MSTIIEINPKYGTPFIEIVIKSYDATIFAQNKDLISSIPGARLGYGYGFLTAYPHAEFDPIQIDYYNYIEKYESSYLTYSNESILGWIPPSVYLHPHPVPEPNSFLLLVVLICLYSLQKIKRFSKNRI